MAKHVDYFFPKMERFLGKNNISFEQYVDAVFHGDVSYDIYILMAISRMWNISISIVSPAFNSPWKVFHNFGNPDVVIVSNGREFGHQRAATHFSSTRKTTRGFKKVGHNITNVDIKFVQGHALGQKKASEYYILCERQSLLKEHYALGKEMEILRKQLDICQAQYDVIGQQLCALEQEESVLTWFRSHEDKFAAEQGFHSMDSGKIWKISLFDDVVELNPSKKQKVHTPTSTAVRLVENEDEAIIEIETTSTEAVASPSDETGNAPIEEVVTESTLNREETEPEVQVIEDETINLQSAVISVDENAQEKDKSKVVIGKIREGRMDRRARGYGVPDDKQDKDIFYCDKCEKNFAHKRGLRAHQTKRCGQTIKDFKCGECNKDLSTMESLREHMAAYHSGEPLYFCSVPGCNESFFYRKHYNDHFKTIHKK